MSAAQEVQAQEVQEDGPLGVVELRDVSKSYPGGVVALRSVDLTIGYGELLGIVGPSGSGKSTLLHIIGALHRPSAGTVRIDSEPGTGTRVSVCLPRVPSSSDGAAR